MAHKKCEKCKTGRARHTLVEIKKYSSVGPTTGGHSGIKEIKNLSLCKNCYKGLASTQVMEGGMDDNENRLARIEKKIDELINRFHKLENTDIRQEMRIDQLEKRVEAYNDSLKRYFERLETLENKTAKAALQVWGEIGSIALSVIITAIITFFLVYLGVKK
jgi:DNA repair exonuclease SbcCD ATPase subunit